MCNNGSNVAAAACTVSVDEHRFHQMWNEHEVQKSSTWRDMKAIEQALFSFKNNLICKSVTWFTDNQNCVKIFESGSRKLELQELAFSIFEFAKNTTSLLTFNGYPEKIMKKPIILVN